MISYEIEAQPLVIGIRDELNRQGYQVWMTTENEDRSLLDSMNRGVELASVVVVAVTRKYKLTPNTFAGKKSFISVDLFISVIYTFMARLRKTNDFSSSLVSRYVIYFLQRLITQINCGKQ